jgi:hypothetical protein
MRKREFKPLRLIRDSYPKYDVTMDELPPSNAEGIVRMHIIDFLAPEKLGL